MLMCGIVCEGDAEVGEEIVWLHPIDTCLINDVECADSTRLMHGDVATFGQVCVVRYPHPLLDMPPFDHAPI